MTPKDRHSKIAPHSGDKLSVKHPSDNVSKLRDINDIIRCHDIIEEILNNDEINSKFNWRLDNSAKDNMIIIKRTLCWVLQHDGGRWLSDNMEKVEQALKAIGFELKKVQ